MGTHKYTFDCPSCNETTTMVAGKTPTWCAPCSDARRDFGAVMRGRNYPRKACAGCGTHMSNFDYGREQYCADCAIVNERRYNRWADPYSKPLIFSADNDNSPMKTCSSCECDLPHSEFSNGAVCHGCRKMLARGADRAAEYEARKVKRAIAAQNPSPAKVKAKRIQRIERANRKRVAEKRAMCRKIDAYLVSWRKADRKRMEAAAKASAMSARIAERPWLAPGLTNYERHKIRAANDNDFAVNDRLRRRLAEQMRLRKRGRCGEAARAVRRVIRGASSLPKFLGYSADELRIHIESLFVDRMTWDAFHRGDIHIDHKTPLSHFDLTDNEQVRRAWALDNLQPLWAADNMAKGARTDEEWRASISAAA